MSVLRDYATAVSQPTLPFTAPGDARYDEVVDPVGSLRPAWKALAERALAVTDDELRRVDGEIVRFLADDGVSYIHPDVGALPWQLDAMPLILDAASWARLDVGLAQRAELLNALLVDLYGDQTLLSKGIIPAPVVLGHSGFARSVARPSAADPHPLLLSAVDLGRDAEGDWHVLADRVQAPSGLGFAMQNRRVISQVIPELYQESSLHRMEPYFSALHATLLNAAPEGVTSPTIVILSPGTMSETAFDQAFLAGALGFPLVQGSDLVVHDGGVWMKPAGWPARNPTERVDVIVRRVDAEWCDPLELRADSRLGVAGLSEAVRRGRVRLVNGLGAGVLENPALMPFLPAAAEHLLGEQLRLPSAPTWWCGDPGSREDVIARLRAGDEGLFVRALDEPRKALAGLDTDALIARIRTAPHRFVGQQLLPLSQAPVWTSAGSAASVPLVLRSFTLRYGSSYRPLVGGLATVRESADAAPTTKDVWVLKASDADPDQGLIEVDPLPAARTVPPLAPRALADMFWVGRYAERTEDFLRLLLTAQHLLDQPGAHRHRDPSAVVLLATLERLAGRHHDDPEAEFRSLLLDTRRRGAPAQSILRLRDALEGVRDQLSGDTWRVFAHIDRATRALRASQHPHRTVESAGRMLSSILSLHGVTANMIRDAGWHMIETGRALERALQLCHILAVGAVDRRTLRADREVLESVLTASESIVTYRRRYRGSMRTADVLDLLLLDADNPRSLLFSLHAIRDHLAALPASTGSSRPERLVDHLITTVDEFDVAELAAVTDGHRSALSETLDDVRAQIEQVADAISQAHFESGPPAVSLSSLAIIEELMEARA
ncbi:circularly permuted type 2 ATP-grasp protein [Microbacterium sp. bgisy189]|uniref:circularly permuted type 2 ATP-grasp protein n=1 Tax=Microbacterium sp. bgisy189 TaxID=3413798 RepID=UPI003EB9600C